MDGAGRRRRGRGINPQLFSRINRGFLFYDGGLAVLSLILCLAFVKQDCVSLMFLCYLGFYLAQVGQHWMIGAFPTIDINLHYVRYRRLVMLVCFVDAAYMFACVIFWQKTPAHPMYCALHQHFGLGMWVGLAMAFHFIFCLAWAVSLIQAYINRRYYLLALGGFEVEQRILEQNRQARENMMIREPDNRDFYIPQSNKEKYFKFDDIAEEESENYECSICYNQDLDSHFVNAGCGHFYHEKCLLDWAKLNESCPQCRHKLEGTTKPE